MARALAAVAAVAAAALAVAVATSVPARAAARAAVPDAARPASAAPPFRGGIAPLTAAQRAAMTPSAWRPGCPVALAGLRSVRVTHWGFDGRVREGRLVVHRDVAPRVLAILRRLYALRFPIRRLEPIEAYGGSDFRSIEADNTSAFNCRTVDGTRRWSEHAYGRALDLNPIENPYVTGDGTSSHAASRPYLDRSRARPGMVRAGDAVALAFAAAGFGWGGSWPGAKDYQHFSSSGR